MRQGKMGKSQRVHSLFTFTLILVYIFSIVACGSEQTEKATSAVTMNKPAETATATIQSTQITQAVATATNPPTTTNPTPTAIVTPKIFDVTDQRGILKQLRPLADPQSFYYQWLKGVPCYAPCWQNITLGQTTFEDAVDLLKKISYLKEVVVTNDQEATAIWKWLEGTRFSRVNGGEGDSGSIVAFTSKDPKGLAKTKEPVALIWPSFPVSYKLGDVFTVYGEPTHVIARMQYQPHCCYGGVPPFYYFVKLVYLSKGFQIEFWDNYEPRLTEATFLEEPKFFVPGMDGFKAIGYQKESELMVPWQGFKPFKFYCRIEKDKNCSDLLKS